MLLHNLRDNDYGRPLSEIRDSFWSNPHKPLLFSGASELRDALFAAIASDDIELVGPSGEVYQVHTSGDINLSSDNIRVQRATCPTCGKPSRECDGHPTCQECNKPSTTASVPSQGQNRRRPPRIWPGEKHWQITLNINTALQPDAPVEELVHLLREITNRIDDGIVRHLNQTTQVTVTCEQDDADEIESLARDANAGINIIPL